MSQPDLDSLYPLSVARERWPTGGRKPHISKIYRLVRTGDHGVRLRALRIAGATLTCDAWISEFLVEADRARRGTDGGAP